MGNKCQGNIRNSLGHHRSLSSEHPMSFSTYKIDIANLATFVIIFNPAVMALLVPSQRLRLLQDRFPIMASRSFRHHKRRRQCGSIASN